MPGSIRRSLSGPSSPESGYCRDCAGSKVCAIRSNQPPTLQNKISKIFRFKRFISIFFDCLPSFTPVVRVEGMKTSHTLIQRRQHRSLCLVSARLPG
ncbi:hypothetical protein EMIT0373P_30771 [Pseudomonas chlororaphis]